MVLAYGTTIIGQGRIVQTDVMRLKVMCPCERMSEECDNFSTPMVHVWCVCVQCGCTPMVHV